MATAAVQQPVGALPAQDTTLFYYLELKDRAFEKRRKHVPHDVNIKDLRSIRDEFSLDKTGFQLVDFTPKEKDFLDEERVKRVYYPEVEELTKKQTGCSHVVIFSHMTRRHTFQDAQDDAKIKNDKEFVTKNNPARFVHIDRSYRGAEQILYLNMPEEEADRRTKNRWGIINIWAPILKPVKKDPLAFCDFHSLDEKDLRTVVANLPPPSARGEYGNVSKNMARKPRAEYSSNGESGARYEVANLAHNPEQQWYYASDMTPDEAWLFKIFDSKKDGRARFAVHSNFSLKGQSDVGDPRTSVELRSFVFWDGDTVE